MTEGAAHIPASYQGVMVSSTFADLKQHRAALMQALRTEELFAIGMEEYVPGPNDDLISSSLDMVRKGSAYIGLISHRYGQVPECTERNPEGYSITRLEFEEAQRIGLPTLVFIMGDDHLIPAGDAETETEKRRKLQDYRERAKEGRIYVTFQSLEDFTQRAIHAVAKLRRYLDEHSASDTMELSSPASASMIKEAEANPIPTPPALYSEPPYIGSHDFVGRKAQLEVLDDWACPADPHPVLLFEAIGGTGKSMLTWEWVTKHARSARGDWAGIFWYSFYERGAVMADFCRRALVYMTRQPIRKFRRMKTAELAELLLHQLKDKPWLVVFDGLERVLVAYHRFDAAQLADEEAGKTDQIANRDPCSAIRPEDDELLRILTRATPSKLLLTSRLVPRVLLNAASQPVPGVLRERLPGLRPPDAEGLIRACGISGDSTAIRRYLQSHCDCHPLVIGVLAGLINDYLPDRGSFDAWAVDPEGGVLLDLAELDLVQKRNHILHSALEALNDKAFQLLSTLALLSVAVDYPTLSALNPHLPPKPENVEEPEDPKEDREWNDYADDVKEWLEEDYKNGLHQREEHDQALMAWHESPAVFAAQRMLLKTVKDLEQRGLLQYDSQAKRHDLHPVVRGIVAGKLLQAEKERFGQRVVDHFSQRAHSSYEEAETLDDVLDGLHIVSTLLQMGHRQQAYAAYSGTSLNTALFVNLEANVETLSLLRPFFPRGWTTLPSDLDTDVAADLVSCAASALYSIGAEEQALDAYSVCLTAR